MELVWVDVGECRCPGSPHPVDRVGLAPHAPIEVGAAVMGAIRTAGGNEIVLQGLMARSFMLGIREWTFTDAQGRPIRVDATSEDFGDLLDDLLPWASGGAEVADRADGLYSQAILRPLLSRTSTSSRDGQMDGSTSAIPPSSPKRRKPAGRSSLTAMDGSRSGS